MFYASNSQIPSEMYVGRAKADYFNSPESICACFRKGELLQIKYRGLVNNWSMVRSLYT
jgi:hypothetical protein